MDTPDVAQATLGTATGGNVPHPAQTTVADLGAPKDTTAEAADQFQEDTSAPEGVAMQAPQRGVKSMGGLGEEEQFLLGPTSKPDVPVTMGARAMSNMNNRVPKEVYNMIPHLIEAAKSPDAPPQLHVLVSLLARHLGAS